ncbi:vacuolar protein sorting 41 [Cryptococcus neoformans Bt1]|nr:vacuolar protein sorting 41 [Cryptococcus neoformans var. grubii Bt1]OXG18062.1 vacuolar protein sorting 41 [Cryptococcus neoformans var. grubii Ze90-1]
MSSSNHSSISPANKPASVNDTPEAGPSVQSPRSRTSSLSSISSSASRKGKERAAVPNADDGYSELSETETESGEQNSEDDNDDDDDDDEEKEESQSSERSGHESENKDGSNTKAKSSEDDEEQIEDDGEEDSEESSDEEEEEPALKYSRLKGRIPEILAKDSASTISVSSRSVALGTHNGMVHILSYEGVKINSFRPHAASVTCLRMDESDDFVATSSVEGRVVIHSLSTPESYAFDYKRPMRAVALEPDFAKKKSRAFVCGGMAGNLILQEKGWMGYKEQILHSGEGPIWAIEWRRNLIAWANDLGVKIYDTNTGQRIGYIDRGASAPRAELFKCTLQWKDDQTLLIGWADHIKIVRVRSRPSSQASGNLAPLTVEMTAIYQVDCMISGVAPFGGSYVILAYVAPDRYENEATDDPTEQRRKAANRPELRIIDKGEETNADALSLANYHMYGCNDYSLVKSQKPQEEAFLVISPADVIVVRPRDEADHIEWLVEKERFQEALEAAEEMQKKHGSALDMKGIGLKYMRHLVSKEQFEQAAGLAPKILEQDVAAWEKWIDIFVQHQQLPAIIPYIPTQRPRLGRRVYEMVFTHLLINDKQALLKVITSWPTEIYDLTTLVEAIQGELQASHDDPLLLECLGELYLINRLPAKALPYFLRIRKPYVFDLIREHNLFTAVRDQALQLVTFDQERKKAQGKGENQRGEKTDDAEMVSVEGDKSKHGAAIQLLVDHVHSIPIDRVVRQLETKPQYLYIYLDALLDKDPQYSLPYSDRMVELYAAYDVDRLMPFLRTSNFYDLEKAYDVCKERDYVLEMVFLLGRMGNNKRALMLLIERLGDVERAIEFAKEQADEDLWEDLLAYSESRPDFIRALLEHVGAEINPIRLISRIRNGMEIPGLKPALVKILQASNLQVSLLEGCQHILNGDCGGLMGQLKKGQTNGLKASSTSTCAVCSKPAFTNPPSLVLIYLCRHLVHAECVLPEGVDLPIRQENASVAYLLADGGRMSGHGGAAWKTRNLGARLGYAAAVRVLVKQCPACERTGTLDKGT